MNIGQPSQLLSNADHFGDARYREGKYPQLHSHTGDQERLVTQRTHHQRSRLMTLCAYRTAVLPISGGEGDAVSSKVLPRHLA